MGVRTASTITASGIWSRSLWGSGLDPKITRAYRGGIRSAPSSRIVSPLSIGFSAIVHGQLRVLAGRPSRCGNGTPAPERLPRLLGQRRQQGSVEQAGGDGAHADRRGRPGRARPAASCRRCRPWRPSRRSGRSGRRRRRSRRSSPPRRARRPSSGSFSFIAVAASRSSVEHPDQVHPHDRLERLQRVGPALGDRALGPADARAAHRQPQRAQRLGRLADGRGRPRPRWSRRSARPCAASPSSAARASAFSSFTSAIATRAPRSTSSRAVASPRPDAPPGDQCSRCRSAPWRADLLALERSEARRRARTARPVGVEAPPVRSPAASARGSTALRRELAR